MTADRKAIDALTAIPISIETLGKQIPLRHSVRSYTDRKIVTQGVTQVTQGTYPCVSKRRTPVLASA